MQKLANYRTAKTPMAWEKMLTEESARVKEPHLKIFACPIKLRETELSITGHPNVMKPGVNGRS